MKFRPAGITEEMFLSETWKTYWLPKRRCSIHSFRYGCLVTTSSISPDLPLPSPYSTKTPEQNFKHFYYTDLKASV